MCFKYDTAQKIFHEKDFQELKEMVEKEQKAKIRLKEHDKNYFMLNEQNITNNVSTAEGTVDIVFRFNGNELIVSNFYLKITGNGTGSHIIEWFIDFCKNNNLENFMIRIVDKKKIAINKICKKFNFKRVGNDDKFNDYILSFI